MTEAPNHPLLSRAIPAAEALIRADHFSVENLCHSLDCGLRDLAEAFPTLDDLIARVNEHFMLEFIERARKNVAPEPKDLDTVCRLSSEWYTHLLEHPQQTRLLLQHNWSFGYVRPDWYLRAVDNCFALIEAPLLRLAPQAPEAKVKALARGIYSTACGLYFLTVNERSTPAGIADQNKLLRLVIESAVQGVQQG